MRAIIVDDEPLARDRLRSLLAREDDVEVIAECADGREAVTTIERENPDLVFLDIQMPELDGFGVLTRLKGQPQPLPLVVFVTAFDEFAVKAFEVHALDYLLKPFDKDRLHATLARAREALKSGSTGGITERLTALLGSLQQPDGLKASPGERMAIKLEGRVIFIRPTDLDWVEAQDNYVKLHLGRESHLVRDTLSNFESRLDPNRFVRIARSTIVNLDRIREMQPMFHGEYVVILQDGTKLTLSRGYREALRQYLGGK